MTNSEPKEGYTRFNEPLMDELLFLADNTQHLNEWEQNLLRDRIGAFKKYKFRAVISVKQRNTLMTLSKGIRLMSVTIPDELPAEL